jgi:hypothetical protein
MEQAMSEFFEPELLEWLLVEMEQNRDKALAACKVGRTTYPLQIMQWAWCCMPSSPTDHWGHCCNEDFTRL